MTAVRFECCLWRSSVASRVAYRRPSVAIEPLQSGCLQVLDRLEIHDNGIFDKKIESMPTHFLAI